MAGLILNPCKVEKFVNEECESPFPLLLRGQEVHRLKFFDLGTPAERVFESQLAAPGSQWSSPPILEKLKQRAKALGLWNMFLSKRHSEGGGYTNLEYALMAEYLGRSTLASEVRYRLAFHQE